MKNIAIIGGGGFCREVKCLIDDINKINPTFELIGFFDDATVFKKTNGIKHLGAISNINSIDYPLCIVVAIADPTTKKEIIEKISNSNIEYPTLIHPSVIRSNDEVNFGKGNIVCAGSILTCNIDVGNFVIINLSCTVGHDTVIEDYCSLMPNVNISGDVILHDLVYVGTGVTVINQITIGEKTIVGAGAVVTKNLPANCTAVGMPAKPINFRN